MNERYTVHFRGCGYTAPNDQNPNGIRVQASGSIVVDGERPARSMDIPFDVIERCKRVFMEQAMCVRYSGDSGSLERFPTVRLGKAL